MSTRRISREAGFAPLRLPRGPNGKPLCRQCGVETPNGRRTFCSNACVDAWKIKTQPGHVRHLVRQRDNGVCAECGKDCAALEKREAELRRLTYRGEYADRDAAKRQIEEQRRAGGLAANRSSYWDADHIVPVVEGGGECDLDNYRTLCVPCHRVVTAALRARLAASRRESAIQPALDLDATPRPTQKASTSPSPTAPETEREG